MVADGSAGADAGCEGDPLAAGEAAGEAAGDAADALPPNFARRFARILSASDMVDSAMSDGARVGERGL